MTIREIRVTTPRLVMSRGDHLEIICRDDQDRELFLAQLGASARTDWRVRS